MGPSVPREDKMTNGRGEHLSLSEETISVVWKICDKMRHSFVAQMNGQALSLGANLAYFQSRQPQMVADDDGDTRERMEMMQRTTSEDGSPNYTHLTVTRSKEI